MHNLNEKIVSMYVGAVMLLIIIVALGLSGCGVKQFANDANGNSGTVSDTADDNAGDAANSGDRSDQGLPTTIPANNGTSTVLPPTTTPPGNIMATDSDGNLVTAPEGSVMENWANNYDALRDSAGFEPPVASGTFVFEGNRYNVEVFRKTASESLINWDKRTGAGDPYESGRTVSTKNGKTGFVYSAGEEGLLPWIHVMVPTVNYVYRFEWKNPAMPSGTTAEETAELIAGDRESYFAVPDHFLDFVSKTNVK